MRPARTGASPRMPAGARHANARNSIKSPGSTSTCSSAHALDSAVTPTSEPKRRVCDESPRRRREAKERTPPAQVVNFQDIMKMYFFHIKEMLAEVPTTTAARPEAAPSSSAVSLPSNSPSIQEFTNKLMVDSEPSTPERPKKPITAPEPTKRVARLEAASKPALASEPTRWTPVRRQQLPSRPPSGPTLSARFFWPSGEMNDGITNRPAGSSPARLVMDAANMPRSQPPADRKLQRPAFVRPGFNGGEMDSILSKYSTPSLRVRGKQMWPARPIRPEIEVGNNERERRWRLDIAHDTLKFLETRNWPMWQPHRVNIRFNVPSKYALSQLPFAQRVKTEIVVSSEDSLSAALRILRSNHSPPYACNRSEIPLVLNMAHGNVPGGGFLHGCRAQEEDLCRLTDLFMALQSAKYPLPEFGANYTFPVSILRGSKHTSYQFLQSSACHPVYFPQIAVLSAAAYINPDLTPAWRRKMTRKVEALLVSACATGHEIIILAAWGCGAFNNPPSVIAEIFATVLQQPQFNGRFKQVIFALDTRRSDRHLDSIAKAFLTALNTKMYRPTDMELDPAVNFVDHPPAPDKPVYENTLRFLAS